MVLHNKSAYPEVCFKLLSYMEDKWHESYSYHTVSHVIDVANVCENYIAHYKIDPGNAELVRIAAISHDIGYLSSPDDHEEAGIIEIGPILEPLLNSKQLAIVYGMIRATKVPQKPNNLYEEILADADLDYLGRSDYDQLSRLLFTEFRHFDMISGEAEWLDIQIEFLENHRYHTSYAKAMRSGQKNIKLTELKHKRLKI